MGVVALGGVEELGSQQREQEKGVHGERHHLNKMVQMLLCLLYNVLLFGTCLLCCEYTAAKIYVTSLLL